MNIVLIRDITDRIPIYNIFTFEKNKPELLYFYFMFVSIIFPTTLIMSSYNCYLEVINLVMTKTFGVESRLSWDYSAIGRQSAALSPTQVDYTTCHSGRRFVCHSRRISSKISTVIFAIDGHWANSIRITILASA